ncbi:unnamed protein product, partial [Prorocentrum cordatum]
NNQYKDYCQIMYPPKNALPTDAMIAQWSDGLTRSVPQAIVMQFQDAPIEQHVDAVGKKTKGKGKGKKSAQTEGIELVNIKTEETH